LCSMWLKLRIHAHSIPSALTIFFNDLPATGPHGGTLQK
jgi:hypothetical protein